MSNLYSVRKSTKQEVQKLYERNPNKKIVIIDVKKEFDEVVKASKTNNQTEPINALEYYKP